MLEAIRDRAQSWIAKLILALILIPFALWGIDSYFEGSGKTEAVAEVGDAKISLQTYSEALKEQAERIRQEAGDEFDPALLNKREFREQVLTRLTEEEAMLEDAKLTGLQVTDTQVAAVLQQLPAFQENGKFSPERYKRILAQRGYTTTYFEHRLRRDITLQAQQQPVISAAMFSATSASLLTRIAGERREVSVADISPQTAADKVAISDQEIRQYYEAHKADYSDPEALRVEYVTLSLDELARSIPVSEQQVQDFFAANKAKFGPPEERSASHILIAAPEGDANARKQAKAKAEAILASVKKAPASFAEVAKRESQDPGSAPAGGSLGKFGRGAMVKAFEDAVFSMKSGEISNLVETQFGFHIIRLDQIHGAVPSLAEVRPQVEEEVRKQQAQKHFAEAAEQFGNIVYEQPSSLKPAADALKLQVQSSDWVTRKGLPQSPFNSPKLLDAVFAADAIKSQQNIEPIEIERNLMVAARVIEHRPTKQKPLAEVSASIRQKLSVEKAAKLTKEMGQSLLAALKQGQEPAGLNWSAFKTVGRQQSGEFDRNTMQAIMRVETTKLPAYLGVPAKDGGFRLIRVTRVIDNEKSDPALRSAVEASLQQAYARVDAQAQVKLATTTHQVEIKEGALDKKE